MKGLSVKIAFYSFCWLIQGFQGPVFTLYCDSFYSIFRSDGIGKPVALVTPTTGPGALTGSDKAVPSESTDAEAVTVNSAANLEQSAPSEVVTLFENATISGQSVSAESVAKSSSDPVLDPVDNPS